MESEVAYVAELEAEKEMLMHETQVESACWESQIWQHNPDGQARLEHRLVRLQGVRESR